MGNIWNVPTPKRQTKTRTLGNYLHAIVYDEPLEYHDKDRPKGNIQIIRKRKGIVTPQQNAPFPNRKEQKKGVRKRMRERDKKHPAPPDQQSRSPEKRNGLKDKIQKAPPKLDDQTEEEKTEKIPKSSMLNERVERAMKRTDKLVKALPLKKKITFPAHIDVWNPKATFIL